MLFNFVAASLVLCLRCTSQHQTTHELAPKFFKVSYNLTLQILLFL